MRPEETFLQQPVRSLQTMLQVISLYDSRIPKLIPDGIYGPTTLNAVNVFQQINGLPITGITDQRTWDSIVTKYNSARIEVERAEPIEILINRGDQLSLGDSGPYVYFIQVMLQQIIGGPASSNDISISGIYDTDTQKAVYEFQKKANIDPTGKVDKQTWKHLVHQFTLNLHHNKRTENVLENLY